MRNKNRRWLLVWASTFLLHVFRCEVAGGDGTLNSTRTENSTSQKELRSVFSPRMDYEQWTPLGRGDPLKNDPTYDYVPPVLERVHYWMDPALRKPDPPLPGDQNQKTEILLLGVSSSKPSTSVAADSRRDTYDPFIKFVDGPKFSTNYQRLSRPHYQIPYSYYPSPYYKNKATYSKNERVPYTMLMPPPIPNPAQEHTTLNPNYGELPSTSESSVTVQEANLIYHSSTAEELDSGDKHVESSSVVTWRTPLPYNEYKFKNHTYMKNNDSQKVLSFAMTLNSDDVQISGPDVMYKGQVSDGDLDLASKYVNIGKPEAQLHSASGIGVETPVLVQAMSKKPMTLQMQTMQPPPIPIPTRMIPLMRPMPTKSGPLASLLQKEATSSLLSTMASFIANIPKAPTTTPTPTTSTTTINSLTTDPLFKHYKQPLEPLRGPMYLIIQGHSKVKTYGPAKQIHGINVQEFNEIPNSDYKDEFQVKHLHTYKKKVEDSPRMGRANSLKSLTEVLQTGFGAIDYADRRIGTDDIQETELDASFDVGANPENSQIYHKGFVEVDKLSRKL